jgi:hypothetical protein
MTSATIGGNLSGTWDITGNVGTITANKGTVDAWGLTVQSGKLGSASLGIVTDASVAVAQGISILTAKGWATGSITADSLQTLSIAGDFDAGLTLAGTGNPVVVNVLNKATITGKLGANSAVAWDITGNVGDIVIKGTVDQFTLGDSQKITKINALNFGDVVSADVDAAFSGGSILAKSWADGTITAGSLKGLKTTTKAAFGADVTLSGAGVASNALALGPVSILGAVSDATISVQGKVGAFIAGAFLNSNLLIGLDSGVSDPFTASATDFTSGASLLSFTLKGGITGVTTTYVGSVVAAAQLGIVTLPTADTSTGPVGFVYSESIRGLRITTPKFIYSVSNTSIDSFEVVQAL